MPKITVKGQTVQTGEHPQTNGRILRRYQTYYRPLRDAVDKYHGYVTIHKVEYFTMWRVISRSVASYVATAVMSFSARRIEFWRSHFSQCCSADWYACDKLQFFDSDSICT